MAGRFESRQVRGGGEHNRQRESVRDHPWPAETTTEALENSIENIILCNFCVFKIKFCSLSVFTVCVHSVFTLFASGACEAYYAARF